MAENPGRVQLSRSIRYLEGLRSRMEFSAFSGLGARFVRF